MDGCVVLNVRYNRDNGEIPTVLKVPTDITWQDLNLLLKLNFDWQNISVKYLDEDGDFILMSSQSELDEAFRVARQSKGVLELKVIDCAPPLKRRFVTTRSDATSVGTPPSIDDTPTSTGDILHVVDRKEEENVNESVAVVNNNTALAKDDTMLAQDDTMFVPDDTMFAQNDTMLDQDDTMETGERVFNPVPVKEKRESKRGARPKHRHMRRAESCYTRCAREIGDHRRSQSTPEVSPGQLLPGVDEESGESASHDNPVSYSDMMVFLSKLKEDLRGEIVRDVTRKTVKQVLKGLDGAVIQAVQGSKSPAKPQPNNPDTGTPSQHASYIHDSIICDNCNQTIVGSRYKCGNCKDYDLCESCELVDGLHDPEHVFIKLRRPWALVGKVNGQKIPLLRCLVYKPTDVQTDRQTDTEDSSTQPRWERFKEKMARMQEKFKKKEEKLLEKHKKKEEKLKRRLEHERSLPVKRERLDVIPPRRRHGKFGAEFIEDLTIPDGTRVQPGTKLIKTWILKNSGNMSWDTATKLKMVWGSMDAVDRQVDVPYLTPGDKGPVTVALIAPATPGRYQSHWKMQYSGSNFGHRVWCTVIVEAKEILEPIVEDNLKVVQEDQGHDVLQIEGDLTKIIPMIPLVSACPVIESVPIVPLLPATSIGDTLSMVPLVCSTVVPDSVPMSPLTLAAPVLDTELPATPGAEKEDKVVDKIEEKLTSAAAVVAQLQRDQHPALPPTDLLSFEMVDADNQEVANVIQAATPNNTPAVLTPPKSPVIGVLSNSSSVEIVGEEDSSPEMVEYVKEKMASLTFNSDMSFELESVSSSTDDDDDDDDDTSSSSDGDFFIVPLPDCFQPDKPLLAGATSTWDENDNLTDMKSVDEILSVSSTVSTPTLSPVDVTQTESGQGEHVNNNKQQCDDKYEASEDKLKKSENKRDVTENQSEVTENQSEVTENQPEVTENQPEVTENQREVTKNQPEVTENQPEVTENQSEVTENQPEVTENQPEVTENQREEPENQSEVTENQSEDSENKPKEGDSAECPGSDQNADQQARAGEFANQLMNTAVSAATRAASQAYCTAKEVFFTWQAKHNTWAPPADTFTPPQSTWTPPENKWTPPENKWTPSENNWTPPANDWIPKSESMDSDVKVDPSVRLLEMGFYDVKLNTELLQRFDGDLEKVVQKLLEQCNNDWANQRH